MAKFAGNLAVVIGKTMTKFLKDGRKSYGCFSQSLITCAIHKQCYWRDVWETTKLEFIHRNTFFFFSNTIRAFNIEVLLLVSMRFYHLLQRGIVFLRWPHLKSCGSAMPHFFVTFGGPMQNTSEKNCGNFQVDPSGLIFLTLFRSSSVFIISL